ncbi:rifampicin phosphotransferase-like [Procambarus clarkii]|uniref:rifampicin phosphotransferase-like n=1 Tax=Procambarus clarkii TaxID=6728 RepID=UPI003743E854
MWQEISYFLVTVLLAYLVYLYLHKGGHGVLYWWRWGRLVVEVWVERLSWQAKVNNHDVRASDYHLCGIEATPTERDYEKPKPLITDRHEDEMTVCGVDSEGRMVVARLVRLTHRRASVFFCVKDHTGAFYTLPNQPDTSQFNVSGEEWRGAGLSLTCVAPMRLWRLSFNGLLRRGCQEQYMTDDASHEGEEDHEEEEMVHMRLDMLWRAMRAPVDVWVHANTRLVAHALAAHPSASLRTFLCEEGDRYEQWGCLHGTVTFPHNDQPQVWYLRGPRCHRWGLGQVMSRSLASFIYFNNGDVCTLHGHTSSTAQYVGGYMQAAAGDLRPVTWTDLNLHHFDHLSTLGNNLLTKFTAGWQSYEVWQRLGAGVTYYTGDPWTLRRTLYPTCVASTHSYGWGVTLLACRYEDLCPVPERESIPAVEVPRVELGEEDGAPLVLTLDDPLCRNPLLTGGKAASLALLTAFTHLPHPHQGQYEVPPGVVVTVAAWHHQLRAFPDLQQAVRAVRQAVGAAQLTQIKDACARAVEVCLGVAVCPPVAQAVEEALLQHLLPHASRLAVRSSGCEEDGEETSAAGQNATVLGVKGVPQVLSAISRCWASMFAFNSVEYRRQRGQGVEAGMGVVVQQMVEAEVAGVMFTVDPVTASPAHITLTANYGLGESVVSATAEPDTLVVRRSWRDRLTLASSTLGAKNTKCVMKAEGGTTHVEVGEKERTKQCLSDTMALRLARLALYLHQAFSSPRDIEFALSQKRVYLLQARPITTLHAWPDYHLTHEQDSAVLTDHDLLTKANTGEVFPESTTPLTVSLLPPALDLAFQMDLHRSHWWPFFTPEPYHIRLCPTYYNHVFLNMLEMQYRDNEERITPTNRAIDLAVYGHDVTTDQYIQWGLERFGLAPTFTKWIFLALLVYDKVRNSRRVKVAKQKFGDYDLGCSWGDSALLLYQEITRRLPDLILVSTTHIYTSKVSSGSQCIAFLLLADGKQELTDENTSDMAALLSSCTGVESADVPTALKVMARVIAQNEEAEEFLGMTSDEGEVWLESHPGTVGHTYRNFIARHGHRCIKEFDLSSLSWGLDSSPLVHTLQAMVRHPTSYTSTKEVITTDEALQHLQSAISSQTRRALQFVLPICRESVAQREATKSLLIKVVDGFRKAYRKLGELLVGEGRLPSPDLVFYLTHAELGDLVTHPAPSLLAKAVRRQHLHTSLDTLKFPEISVGVPRPMTPETPDETEVTGSGQVIIGTPVCHGMVTSVARVVTSLSDAPTIQSGDILVTVSTDVGWTPYFPLLAGVVTEIGGLISHGAVVAREYGLPCVVGVARVTSLIHSGDKILLNATRGTITRLTPPAPATPPSSHTQNKITTGQEISSSKEWDNMNSRAGSSRLAATLR